MAVFGWKPLFSFPAHCGGTGATTGESGESTSQPGLRQHGGSCSLWGHVPATRYKRAGIPRRISRGTCFSTQLAVFLGRLKSRIGDFLSN